MSSNGRPADAAWIGSALKEHEANLLRYAHRILRDAERARDVVQDTFLRMSKQSPAELDGHLTEWLYTVCRNRALDVRRKEKRMSALTEERLPAVAEGNPGPAAEVERRDTTEHVLALVEQLPENQQEVIRLKFQGGLSYREISGVTGLSVSNVGFLIHRGMKTLRGKVLRAER